MGEEGSFIDEARPANKKENRKREKRAAPAADVKASSALVVSRHVLAQFGGGGGGGGMGGMSPGQATCTREDQLMDILTTVVMPDSWDVVGGPGTIAEFDGLIVIRQNAHIHRQIERVLKMLREASGQQPWTGQAGASSHPSGGGGFF